MDKKTYKEAHDSNYSGFRNNLKKLCEIAGVEYKSPHKGRYGYIHEAMKEAKTMHDFQAIAQAVMDKLPTVMNVYARMGHQDSIQTIRGFSFNQKEDESITSDELDVLIPEFKKLSRKDKNYIIDLVQRLSGG